MDENDSLWSSGMAGDGECLSADLAAFMAFFLILVIAAVALCDLPPTD